MTREITTQQLKEIKIGDVIERLLGGCIPMKLNVTNISETEIMAGPWKFDRNTGAEIDEDLDWDGITSTGSYINRVNHYP